MPKKHNPLYLDVEPLFTDLEVALADVKNALAFATTNNGTTLNETTVGQKFVDFDMAEKVLVKDGAAKARKCLDLVERIRSKIERGAQG